jgi:hypothetical protein
LAVILPERSSFESCALATPNNANKRATTSANETHAARAQAMGLPIELLLE